MAKLTMTHDVDCGIDAFWKFFLDGEFNDKLYKGLLGFPEFTIVDQTDSATKVSRKVSARPKMNVPAPLAKLFGSNFRYTEAGTLDKATNTWRWKMTPSVLADKLRNEGSLRIERIDDGRVRRIVEIVIEAKVFVVGGLIEETSLAQLRDGWEKSAAFTNQWIRDARAK